MASISILKNIEWYIQSNPKQAVNKTTKLPLTKEEMDAVIFDGTQKVKIQFPLNDNYLFFVDKRIECPVTVKKLLNFIYKFYKSPLNPDHIDKAFEEMEEWRDIVISEYGDASELKNIDVFTDTVPPDFVGLEKTKTGAYVVRLGPV